MEAVDKSAPRSLCGRILSSLCWAFVWFLSGVAVCIVTWAVSRSEYDQLDVMDFTLRLPSGMSSLSKTLTDISQKSIKLLESGKRLYIPSIPDDYGFYVRTGSVPKVSSVNEEDIKYGSLYGRVFSVMRLFQRLTKRPCMAMHHLDGYDGEAKNVIGILLDNNRNYIRAMNVEIIGNSTHIIEDVYESTLCPGVSSQAAGSDIIYIKYIEYSDDYYIKYPESVKSVVRKSGGASMKLRLEGLTSLCVQRALDEINGAYTTCPQKTHPMPSRDT